MVNYMESIQLLDINSEKIGDFIQSQLSKILSKQSNISNIQALIDLIAYCKPDKKLSINK